MKRAAGDTLLATTVALVVLVLGISVISVGTVAAQDLGATESTDSSFSGVQNVAHVSDGSVEVRTTFDLRASDGRLNYWDVGFSLPEGARVVSIEDTYGEIESYQVDGDALEFRTNTAEARESETVRVEYVMEDAVVEEYGDLTIVEVGFVGFGKESDEAGRTFTRITADETVLSASYPEGFSSTVTKEEVVYEGGGSATVRVAVGDGEEYDSYAVFGDRGADIDLSEVDDLYSLVPRAFGFEASVNKHPVVVLGDEEYEEEATEWGEGRHRSSGVILLRDSSDDVTETVLHETVHAHNAEALSWSDSTVGWFEEGTAEYIEFLADRARGKTRPALFVDNRTREDGSIEPRGDVDRLLGYYDGGNEFMRTWKPSRASKEVRGFGYVFSELIIRSYVRENGADALHETYDSLRDIDRRATTPQGATDVVLDAMNEDLGVLRPCDTGSRSETVDCLRRVNTMDATVPAYDGIESATYTLDGSKVPSDDGGEGNGTGLLFVLLLVLIFGAGAAWILNE